jgi:hypothetical protein
MQDGDSPTVMPICWMRAMTADDARGYFERLSGSARNGGRWVRLWGRVMGIWVVGVPIDIFRIHIYDFS